MLSLAPPAVPTLGCSKRSPAGWCRSVGVTSGSGWGRGSYGDTEVLDHRHLHENHDPKCLSSGPQAPKDAWKRPPPISHHLACTPPCTVSVLFPVCLYPWALLRQLRYLMHSPIPFGYSSALSGTWGGVPLEKAKRRGEAKRNPEKRSWASLFQGL